MRFMVRVLLWLLAWFVVGVAILATPVVVLLFSGGEPREDRCSRSTPALRIPDHAAADRLERALRGLPGVIGTKVEFDPAPWPRHAERVKLWVAFAADAGRDQALAAVPPAVEGLRGPEFAGLDVYVAFAFDPAAPGSGPDAPGFHVVGALPTDDVLADAGLWLDLRPRHPGTSMELCDDADGGVNRTVEVPVAGDGDPSRISAAFADLRALPLSTLDWTRATVRTVDAPGQASHTGALRFTVVDDVPDDEMVRLMTSAVRRPSSMSPTDEFEATVTWFPAPGDHIPYLDVRIELDVAEPRPAPASEELDPGGRARAVASAFAAQVKATGQPYRLDVGLGNTQILHEQSF